MKESILSRIENARELLDLSLAMSHARKIKDCQPNIRRKWEKAYEKRKAELEAKAP